MYLWSDMVKVKKDLWNKLHQVKSAVKDSAVALAQIAASSVYKLKNHFMPEVE